MLNRRMNAVNAVRADLQDMEAAADNAAVTLLSGIADMILQRREAGLPFGTGSDTLVRLSDAAAAQLRTNAALAEAHHELATLPAKIGIRAYGDVMPCEPDKLFESTGAGLHVVSA